jgi:hypothetical protein
LFQACCEWPARTETIRPGFGRTFLYYFTHFSHRYEYALKFLVFRLPFASFFAIVGHTGIDHALCTSLGMADIPPLVTTTTALSLYYYGTCHTNSLAPVRKRPAFSLFLLWLPCRFQCIS